MKLERNQFIKRNFDFSAILDVPPFYGSPPHMIQRKWSHGFGIQFRMDIPEVRPRQTAKEPGPGPKLSTGSVCIPGPGPNMCPRDLDLFPVRLFIYDCIKRSDMNPMISLDKISIGFRMSRQGSVQREHYTIPKPKMHKS